WIVQRAPDACELLVNSPSPLVLLPADRRIQRDGIVGEYGCKTRHCTFGAKQECNIHQVVDAAKHRKPRLHAEQISQEEGIARLVYTVDEAGLGEPQHPGPGN